MEVADIAIGMVVAVTTIAVALMCRASAVGSVLRVTGLVTVALMLGIGLAATTYAGDSPAVRRGAVEFLGFYGGVVFLAELAWLAVSVLAIVFRRCRDRPV